MKYLVYQVTLLVFIAVIICPAALLRAEDKIPIVFLADELAKQKAATFKFDHSHSAWNEILKAIVVINGAKSTVDYLALRRNPKTLEKYIYSLSDITQEQYNRYIS